MKARGNTTGLILQKGTRVDADEDGLFTMTRKFACLKSAFPALRGNFETATDDDALSLIANGYTPSYPLMSITDWSSVDDGPKTYIDTIFKGTIDALRDPKWSQTGTLYLTGQNRNPYTNDNISDILSMAASSTIMTARYWSETLIDEPQFHGDVLPFIAPLAADVTSAVAGLTVTLTNPTVASIVVAGAGTATSDGTYSPIGYYNGRHKYLKDGDIDSNIHWESTPKVWVLYDAALGYNSYKTSAPSPSPWTGTWIVTAYGTAPVPGFAISGGTQRAILTLNAINRYYMNATGSFAVNLTPVLKYNGVYSTPVGKLFRVVESYYATVGRLVPVIYSWEDPRGPSTGTFVTT